MSFLTTGPFKRPAFAVTVLQDDPRALVRRAVLAGLIAPPPPPLTPEQLAKESHRLANAAARARRKAGTPRLRIPKLSLSPEERLQRLREQKNASKRRSRARLKAQGLTTEGLPPRHRAKSAGKALRPNFG